MGWESSLAADEKIDIQLDLVGRRQFMREMAEAAAAIRTIERSTDRAGASMAASARHGFLWNQAMFTARRMAYDFTLAVGAAATAVAVLGFNFNRNMETSTVALKFLLGSEQAARKELDFLYQLAARTPFQFAELTDVSRRFLSWGFSVQFTNRALTATADAMSAMGGDPEIIRRIVRAFGQIRSRGKVMGEELNQLAEAGIPAYQFLREELGLTGEQLARVGELGIPANVAIEAIVRGMERGPLQGGFKGAAEELSKTVTGQLSTIADFAQQLFGTIMIAPFTAMQDSLPQVSETMQAMSEAMRDQGFMAMVHAFDEGADAGGRVVTVMEYLIGVGKDLGTIFSKGLWPAIWANAKIIIALLLPALWALAQVLHGVALISDQLAPIIAILTFWWLAEKTALMLNAIWTGRSIVGKTLLAFWERVLRRETQAATLWTTLNTAATRGYVFVATLAVFWTRLWSVATLGYIKNARGQFVAMTLLERGTLRLRLALMRTVTWIVASAVATWGFTVALLANPITWIVIGIAALVAVLVLAVRHFGFATTAVILLTGVFMPLLGIVLVLTRNWDRFTWALGRAWNMMKSMYVWLQGHKIDLASMIPGVGLFRAGRRFIGGLGGIVGLQHGGTMLSAGQVLVGERGPEVLHLPARASVEPLSMGKMKWGDDGPRFTIVPAPVIIDGREVAEVVFSHRLDRIART